MTDTLPVGFSYTPGSTTGGTTANPSIAGRDLTWAGPIVVPAAGTATISFDVTVATTAGTYTNEASAVADGGFTVVPSGATAPVEVTAVSTSLSIGDVTVTEGDSGTVNAVFPVTLGSPAGSTVTVHAATTNGSATAPADYAATTADLTFAPGETTKNVTVQVKGDTLDEVNETFDVTLSAATNAGVADGSAVGTVTDDDDPPSVSVADVTVTEGNAGTVDATFVTSLSGPSGRTVTADYATADASAASPADYASATGAVSFAPGETTKNVTIAVKGDLLDEADEVFTLALSNVLNAGVSDGSGTGTITDDDPAPSLSVADVAVTEGDSGTVEMTFSASLSAPSGRTVTADFATADGSASNPGDYASLAGTVTFSPGQTSRPMVVVVKSDTLDETDETLALTLSNAVNASLSDGAATGTIVDDDGPAVSVGDVTKAEGDSGESAATFTLSLSAPSPQPVGVTVTTSEGTASAPGDFGSLSTTVTIPAGEISKTVDVAVKGDTLDEPDETFQLALSAPVRATLGDASGTGTITDDDGPPALAISDVTVLEGNAGSVAATFAVSLSAASGKAVTVDFVTSNASAAAPADYSSASGSLTFAPGELAKSVAVNVNGDTTDEPNETFVVTLSNPANATLADAAGTGTITDDDPAQQPPTGGGPIGKPDVPTEVDVDAICPVSKKKRGKTLQKSGKLDGTVTFALAGRATWDLFAEQPGKKRGSTSRFRLGKLTKKVSAGAAQFKIVINRGRCKRLNRAVARYGAERVTLLMTITLAPRTGASTTQRTRIRLSD